jgi:hypothetical protein
MHIIEIKAHRLFRLDAEMYKKIANFTDAFTKKFRKKKLTNIT